MALITTEGRNELTALYVAMINVAPGSTSLSAMVASAEGGKTLAQIAAGLALEAGFAANFPGFLTGQEFADKLVLKLLPSTTPAAALTWSTNWVTSQLNGGKSRAQVITEAVLALRASTLTNYADAKAQLANKVDVSLYYAITKTQAADSASAVASVTATATTATAAKTALDNSVTGASFSLSTNTDNLIGDTGNNSFSGSATTLTAGDKIDGLGGTDTLNLTVTGTAPAFTLTSVEVVDITASPNPATVDLIGSTGITDIINDNSANGATLTVNNVGNVVNTTLKGSQTATTIGYTTAAVLGTADASTLTLSAVAAGSSFTGNGVETMTVSSTTAANVLGTLTNTALKTLNITGDQALTISNSVGGATIATVNAAAATGAITLTTGAGVGGTALAGVAVTGPTATGSIDVTTGGNKDTVTLGSGNNTVKTLGGDDTITSGTGTNTITPGTGNDTINLGAGVDTVRFAEAISTSADTINNFGATDVIAVSLGTAATSTALANAATGLLGIVQTGATTLTLPGVGGTGTGTAISFQSVAPNATATSGTVLAATNVVSLNGAYTDGTVGGAITALGTTAGVGIATTPTGKFLLVTYSVGNIAQVWSYGGDGTGTGTVDTNIEAGELNLVATLNGVSLGGLTAANFSTYLTPVAATSTVSSTGQVINLTTPLNTVLNTANTAGQFLTAAADTINVSVGMLPTAAATATSGLTIIDSATGDADVLNATVLAAGWNLGTVVSGIENVNLNMLVADADGFAMSSILPGTTTLTVSGASNLQAISGILSGTAFGLGAGYTGTLGIVQGAVLPAATLNLNGTAGTSALTSPTVTAAQNITALTVNVNASGTLVMDIAAAGVSATTTLNGSGDLTIFSTGAMAGAANIVAASPAYTGTLTFRPSDIAVQDYSVAAAGLVTGLKGLNLSDIAAAAPFTATQIVTLPAVTGGGTFTVTHTPVAADAGAMDALVVNQLGSSLSDTLNVSLGALSTGITVAASVGITAASTETLNLSSAATAGTAITIGVGGTAGGVTLAAALGTQTVNVSGSQAWSLTTVTADVLNTTGVGSTGSVSAILANGTAGAIFNGGAGAATIIGSTSADSFTGGAGNDSFRNTASGAAVTAADKMTGGGGNDTYILSGDSAQAAVAVATAYTVVPNVTDFSISGANGVDILALSATIGNYAGGSAFFAGVATAAAGSTAIQSVAASSGAVGIVAGTDLIKLTTATAVTGDLQTLFNAAIGSSTITTLTANDDIFFTVYDSTNLKMLIGLVNSAGGATTTVVETADVVTLIGSVDMTAANYALFAAANLSIVAA